MAIGLIRVPRPRRLTLLRGLSPVALAGTGVLGLAGVAMAWMYLGAISHLWTTTYGQVLMLKLAGFGGAALFGLKNWRRFAAERLGTAHSEQLGSFVLELVLVTFVVAATAVLTELPHP
jgi:putative copper export protein